MIRVPTVLILGAGASTPFGYPVGGELTDRIKKELRPDQPGQLYHDLISAGFSSDLLLRFRNELRYSQRRSIDSFLENWETEFMDVGKAAIAASLIRHEDRDKVIDEPNWYSRFFSEITDESIFPENRLGIVTFNYDRSLEYYLLRCLPSAYHVAEAEAVKWVSQMRIVHMYGSLGSLPELSAGGRAYGESGTAATLAAAKEIHLVRRSATSQSFNDARNLMKGAERIIVLGFGFEKNNLARLGMMDFAKSAEIIATLYKVCPVDEKRIKATHPEFDIHAEPTYEPQECIEWFEGDALKFMENRGIGDP